ncbi:MAG: helix-turn-helix domain-containing protein [Chloroflexota bacterium]
MRDRLASLVEESGLSQAEIARRIGESASWVNHRLIGRTDIKADDIPKLASALGVSPCAFFEEGPAGAEPVMERLAQRAAEIAVARVEDRIREYLHEAMWTVVREAPRREEAAPAPVAPAMPEDRESDVLGALGIAPDDPRWPGAMRVLRRLDEMLGSLSPFEQELVERMVEARRQLREEEQEERVEEEQGR